MGGFDLTLGFLDVSSADFWHRAELELESFGRAVAGGAAGAGVAPALPFAPGVVVGRVVG